MTHGTETRARARRAACSPTSASSSTTSSSPAALLRVTVDRADGASIDIDAITAADPRDLSRALDEHDPIPSRYTLEVSSPGLERPLRTPGPLRPGGRRRRSQSRPRPSVEGDRRVTGTAHRRRRRRHHRAHRATTVRSRAGSPTTTSSGPAPSSSGVRRRSARRRRRSAQARAKTPSAATQASARSYAMSTGNLDMMEALQMLAAEKGISVDTLLEALADALESAYKRMPGAADEAGVTIDPDTVEIRVIGPGARRGRQLGQPERDDTPDDFGRIAAQTAKQVMSQRIREAEREHEVRGVRRPRGRHRHRHHPAERQPLHAARPRARSRRCCPRPSRCPTSGPSPAPG